VPEWQIFYLSPFRENRLLRHLPLIAQPLRPHLFHPSPDGFERTLTWKGEGSLWLAPEASADGSIFPSFAAGLATPSDVEPPPRCLSFVAETHTLISRYSIVSRTALF
jgi:hypothetical protein